MYFIWISGSQQAILKLHSCKVDNCGCFQAAIVVFALQRADMVTYEQTQNRLFLSLSSLLSTSVMHNTATCGKGKVASLCYCWITVLLIRAQCCSAVWWILQRDLVKKEFTDTRMKRFQSCIKLSKMSKNSSVAIYWWDCRRHLPILFF